MALSPQLSLGLELSGSAHFSNFTPGDNEELLSLVQAFATGERDRFIYLWGVSGAGKTHLMQAACEVAISRRESAVYITMSEAHEYCEQIFEGLSYCSLVCIDDIQCIAGNREWEEAIFVLYESLMDHGGRLMVAGNAHPKQLNLCLADLTSRLCWGQCLRVMPLSDEQIAEALVVQAKDSGLIMPEDVIAFILRRVKRDMNSITALFQRLNHASIVEQRKLTVPFVKQVLNL